MSQYVHGSTDPREIARLEKQADFAARFVFPHFDAAPGMRVLDLATGVGAMASRLLRAFPGIDLTGVDLSPHQLAAARQNHGEISYVRANGGRLPFADASFDRVHCSWLLEHLPDPISVLREVRRVLRPGGYCQFIEVDNATFGTTPRFEEITRVMQAIATAQSRAGGDPFIGQILHRYFTVAGFRRFTIEPVPLRGSQADLPFLHAFIDEFAEIFESVDEALGPQLVPMIHTAIAQLRSLSERPDGAMRYTGRLAKGWK